MKLAVNAILVLLIAGLAFILYSSIKEPINFKNEYDKRKDAVVERLTQIRTAQESFRSITGEFAPSFDTLVQVLSSESFAQVSITGDPNDPDNEELYRYDTTFLSAKDSMMAMGIELNSLETVPFGNGAKFSVYADTITYQKTLVHVCQVETTYDKFMGPYADEKYTKYDDSYVPTASIRFGSRSAPNLAGNW